MNLLKPASKTVRSLFGFFYKKKTDGTLDNLQAAIGYRFKSIGLLKQALTHKSAVTAEDSKGLMSNERLEFLGDSVLNCLVTEHLYLNNPDKSEGQLSKIKSLIVSRKILGEIAVSVDLGPYMIFGISEIKSGVKTDNPLSQMRLRLLSVLFTLMVVWMLQGLSLKNIFMEGSVNSLKMSET